MKLRLVILSIIAFGLLPLNAAPSRVVSMNLCTDQMAMALSDPTQLLSVSYISRDLRLSPYADQVEKYAVNHGQAEEIYAMAPDLVLVDPYSDHLVVGLLRNLGVNIAVFQSAKRIDEIPAKIREMGVLLGRETKAELLARRFEAGLSGFDEARVAPSPTVALFGANGYSNGVETLSGDIVARLGLDNLATHLGLDYGGNIALESLAINPPDYLITTPIYEGASNAEAIMSHPVITALTQAGETQILHSSADWACGTAKVLDALRALAAEIDEVAS